MKNNFVKTLNIKGFDPIYGKVLFLGTAVGGNSMKRGFYYMDKNNKFWELIDKLCQTSFFSNKKNEYLCSLNDENKKLKIRNEMKQKLQEYGIGISDIIKSCENTTNSSDKGIIKSSIDYNDKLNDLIEKAKVVILNGIRRTVTEFYKAVQTLNINISNKEVIAVYSSSGAANGTKEKRDEMWISIKKYL